MPFEGSAAPSISIILEDCRLKTTLTFLSLFTNSAHQPVPRGKCFSLTVKQLNQSQKYFLLKRLHRCVTLGLYSINVCMRRMYHNMGIIGQTHVKRVGVGWLLPWRSGGMNLFQTSVLLPCLYPLCSVFPVTNCQFELAVSKDFGYLVIR